MRYLQNENDTLVFKTGDTSETIRLSARNDNSPIIWSDGDTAEIHVDKDKAHVKTAPATLVIGSNNVTFSTSELSDLPAGQYQLEVWTKLASDGTQAIWPSQGMLDFTIDRNADSLEGGAIATVTLDTFKKQLNAAIEEAKKQATPGKSAYEEWLDAGNEGTEQDFLNSLKGAKGDQGVTGQSAYQEWLDNGNTGTKEDFLNSLKGDKGDSGLSAYQLAVQAGFKGSESEWLDFLRKGPVGATGKSAYQVWLDAGHKGTETDFLNSLIGPKGDTGSTGQSAYDIWKSNGNVGDEQAFLKSLVGPKGNTGESAYQAAVDSGFTGSQNDWLRSLNGESAYDLAVAAGFKGDMKSWLKSLVGPKGDKGEPGKDAKAPTLKMGAVQSVASDQPAKAELIDNKDNSYTLTLSIPAGAKGETGGVNQVVKPDLTIGTITTINNGEKASASLTKTGETSYAINLSIPAGKDGSDGVGEPGADGKSAYDLAVQEGFKGDLKAWLDSLKGQPGKDATGKPGADGKSAYQIWKDQGNSGTEQDFLNSLRGAQGEPGKDAVGTPGKDGRRGTAIFTTSDYINPDVNPITISMASLKSSDVTLKPMVGDYIIGTVNASTQILEITVVNSDTVELSSDMIDIQGQAGQIGLQGHSIWYVDAPVSPMSYITTSSIAGRTSYGPQPQTGDVLIGKDGNVATIENITYGTTNPMTGQATVQAVQPGQIIGTLGGQSETPTNEGFDYDKLPKLTIVDQNKLGEYLGLDSSKSYTLDIDDFTLNDGKNDIKAFLKPGIYLLRDVANHGYNLTIKSSSNMAGSYGNPVQLIVTPYTVIATTAGSTAGWFIRTDWSHDLMPYYGINNSWVKLAEGPKSAN